MIHIDSNGASAPNSQPSVAPIAIDLNIPRPKSGGRNSLAKYPWREMEVGNSFLFPREMKMAAASSNANCAQGRTGFKFSCRTTPEGIRCWRIS